MTLKPALARLSVGLFVFAVIAAYAGVTSDAAAPEMPKVQHAVCVLRPVGDSGASGVLHFTQRGNMVLISGEIKGLKPGMHGFHVHEFGDVSDAESGKSAGGHYNPENKPHGAPGDKERHVGDLGNIEAGANGTATVKIRDGVIQLNGPHSIVGRSIVVHADSDKFTQPTGDAGARAAVGVIGIAK